MCQVSAPLCESRWCSSSTTSSPDSAKACSMLSVKRDTAPLSPPFSRRQRKQSLFHVPSVIFIDLHASDSDIEDDDASHASTASGSISSRSTTPTSQPSPVLAAASAAPRLRPNLTSRTALPRRSSKELLSTCVDTPASRRRSAYGNCPFNDHSPSCPKR